MEASSPHRLPALEQGNYLIIVKAYDSAGNWKEGTAKLHIFPEGLILDKKGIQFRDIRLSWWLLILILIIMIILLTSYLWNKHRESIRARSERLKKSEEKLGIHHKKILDKSNEFF